MGSTVSIQQIILLSFFALFAAGWDNCTLYGAPSSTIIQAERSSDSRQSTYQQGKADRNADTTDRGFTLHVYRLQERQGTARHYGADALVDLLGRPHTSQVRASTADASIIKCLTPAIKYYRQHREHLSSSQRRQIDEMLNQKTQLSGQPDSLLSPSGKFELHYTTSGQDSVPVTDENANGVPDYVESAAEYADSTWQREIEQLGYPDPLQRQPAPYDIYFANTGYYGATFRQSDDSGTYFEVHRNFNGFPDNTDPAGDRLGALKATIAHEFKHAINFFITRWDGEIDDWAEMDATLMEELVFDQVNDYYNYIRTDFSIFKSPDMSLYAGRYRHVSFALYFTETFGTSFWTQLWEDIESGYNQNSNPAMIGSLDTLLKQTTIEAFPYHFTRNHLWHFATGSTRVARDFGFSERYAQFQGTYAYPASTLYHNDTTGVPDSLSNYRLVSNLAAHHLNILPQERDYGPVQVSVEYDSTMVGVGLIGYTDDGVRTHIQTSRDQDSVLLRPDWWWDSIDRLGVVVTNPDPNNFSISYRIRYGTLDHPIVDNDLPKQDELRPNYPNPFNQSTTLRFFLTRQQNVEINVYDITGRRVRSLRSATLNPGPHRITFNADNLSSGLYIYRVVTDSRAMTGKMMLVR